MLRSCGSRTVGSIVSRTCVRLTVKRSTYCARLCVSVCQCHSGLCIVLASVAVARAELSIAICLPRSHWRTYIREDFYHIAHTLDVRTTTYIRNECVCLQGGMKTFQYNGNYMLL